MKLLALIFLPSMISTTAWADMIEIKGRGVLNGKIVSQDASEVRFKDSDNNLYVVPRADVLFMEAQSDISSPPAAAKAVFDWKALVNKWAGKARMVWRDIRYRFEKKVERQNNPGSAPQAVGRSTKSTESSYEAEGWDIKKERESSNRFVRPADSAPMLDNQGRRIRYPKYKTNKDVGFSLEESQT